MNITQKNIDALNAELTIRLEPTDYNETYEKAIKDYRKNVNMPGFRPGHVPVGLVKQRFGKSILAEQINKMLQDAIYKHISENNINVLGNPLPVDTDNDLGNWDNPSDFQFTYQLGIAPEVTVALDSAMMFDFYRVDVNEELIGRQMKDLARRYGKLSSPETSDAEDMLMADLAQLDADGNNLEGGIQSKTTVSIEYIKDEDTKKNLIGLKKDDVVKVNPHLLSTNHEDLARMLGITHDQVHHLSGLFQLTVTEIKRMEPAELNQELFDKLFSENKVTSEAEMKDRVKEDLEKMFEKDSEWLFKREFVKTIVDKVNPTLPDAFLKRWIIMTNEKPIEEEAIEKEYPSYAGGLKWQLIQSKIIRDNEIKVTMDEAKSHVKSILAERYAQYGMSLEDEQLEELAKKSLSNREEVQNIYDFLYEDKVAKIVREKCTINVKKLSYDEFVHKVQH